MRSVRLGRTFDAVFVHDAIAYMTTEDDLRAVFATAFEHTRPGGVALFVPDAVTETFEPAADHGGHDGPTARCATSSGPGIRTRTTRRCGWTSPTCSTNRTGRCTPSSTSTSAGCSLGRRGSG